RSSDLHMPAALPFPIGSRFYDWKYESEPEPYMNGRRIYHARGKVLGGSSSINGMIFQRGNPLDYEKWAAEPGLGRPLLVVERVAALEDHAVDRARAAEHLAARVVDAAAVHVRLGLGLVLPVVEAAADRERQRGRHVEVRRA